MALTFRKARLTVCIIARDSAATLAAALASIRPWVDEIIVLDTGSLDNTREIARRFSARVFEFPWCDDFSAARNESLRHATGDWIFWMDSDDTIDEENGRKLRELVDGEHDANILAYTMQVHCPGNGDFGADDSTVVDHVKLFRNHLGIHFVFRIHEQVLPSIRKLGGAVGWTDIFVLHSGSDRSPAGRRKKCERDLRLLELELHDRPEHPFTLFNYGMTYADMGEHANAVEYLLRCLKVSSPAETQVRKAYALLIQSYDGLQNKAAAWETCEKSLRYFPDDPELLFLRGNLALTAGQFDAARDSYRRVLANGCERHFSSINRGIAGYKSLQNLALVYQQMQRPDLAELALHQTIQSEPRFRPPWRSLGEVLVAQKKFAATESLLDEMQGHPDLTVEGTLIAAELEITRNQVGAARERLVSAVDNQPDADDLLEALCKLEFHHGDPAAAQARLKQRIEHKPDDAAAYHNLGVVYAKSGDLQAAKDAYQRSLNLRPNSPATREFLENVNRELETAPCAQPKPVAPAVNHLPVVKAEPDSAIDSAPLSGAMAASSRGPRPLNVALVTVGYNLPGATRTLIESALRGCRHNITSLVFSHTLMPEKIAELEELSRRADVVLRDYRSNRGLARSWNEGILWAFENKQDVVLVVNEDVEFSEGDVSNMAETAFEQRDKFLVMGRCFHEHENNWSSSEYGCFAVNPLALEVLGCFDENFFPIYYEDSDYRRRANLAGLTPGYCDRVAIRHSGSASLRQPAAALQNQLTYAGNRAYYMRKWGGESGSESFDSPFNDPRFSYYIDPRVRQTPYPKFDRCDQHIVEV